MQHQPTAYSYISFRYMLLCCDVQELLKCQSAGVMCAIAAAFPSTYLEATATVVRYPSTQLEFDLRGRIDVGATSSYAYVDTGEVKATPDYGSAVSQLGVRLGTLRWLIQAYFPAEKIILVGRLFIPKQRSRNQFVDPGQRQLAQDEWNYSLYVHFV